MCGIAGRASTTPETDRSWLPVARDMLTHRGPDDAGLWWSDDGRVGLAHRRLSILDDPPWGTSQCTSRSAGCQSCSNGESSHNYAELRQDRAARPWVSLRVSSKVLCGLCPVGR